MSCCRSDRHEAILNGSVWAEVNATTINAPGAIAACRRTQVHAMLVVSSVSHPRTHVIPDLLVALVSSTLRAASSPLGRLPHKTTNRRLTMPILLWLLGIPIPIIILLLLLWH